MEIYYIYIYIYTKILSVKLDFHRIKFHLHIIYNDLRQSVKSYYYKFFVPYHIVIAKIYMY